MAAIFDLTGERDECCSGVWRVVQHADTKGIVKCFLERQLEDVALDDVSVRQTACERERRLDAVAEIDADDIRGSPFGRKLCMPAVAAAAFEDDLALKEFRCYRLQPAEQLVGVFLVRLREM